MFPLVFLFLTYLLSHLANYFMQLSVTSDRGLIERIEKEGGKVMKPKKWMLTAATLIAGHEVSNLDTWMDQWCNSQIDL